MGHTILYDGREYGQSTVYIYDKLIKNIPNGASSEIIIDEFNNATKDVIMRCQILQDCTIESLDRFALGPEDKPNVACAVFTIATQSARRLSFLFLSGCAHKFVKIRATLNTSDSADLTAYDFAGKFFMEHFKHSFQSEQSSH